MIERSDSSKFVEWAVSSQFGILIEKQLLPRKPNGKLLVAGMFAVPNSRASQRLIIDRRPQNRTETQLLWLHLPHGSMFGNARLGPHQDIRGSGDDFNVSVTKLLTSQAGGRDKLLVDESMVMTSPNWAWTQRRVAVWLARWLPWEILMELQWHK